MNENEQKAIAVGENVKLLRQRLMEARSVLSTQYFHRFNNFTFDKAGKRLVSGNCALALQWKVRAFPDQPVSYQNQQTNGGNVCLIRLDSGVARNQVS